jgi:hypothetical protein
MTRDSNAMAAMEIMRDPNTLYKMLMHLLPEERQKQLHSIMISRNDVSLCSDIIIKVVIDQPGGPEMYYGTFQVSDYCAYFSPPPIAQRCLKKMEQIIKEAEKRYEDNVK